MQILQVETLMSSPRTRFEILRDELLLLNTRWNLVEDLFCEEATVELLNASAPDAFQTIFGAFVDLVVLGIARLVTDRDQRALTLRSLMHEYKSTPLEQTLAEILDDIQANIMKVHRDKRIAHHDADAAGSPHSGSAPYTLPPITRSQIEAALDGMRRFMNAISLSEEDSEFHYQRVLSNGDARQLAIVLKEGLRLRELREQIWMGASSAHVVEELRKYPDQYPAG